MPTCPSRAWYRLLLASLSAALPLALAAAGHDLGGGVLIELVDVPAGNVHLGSPDDEPGRGDDEPRRTVRLTAPFSIGRTPVTRGQFARFAAATGHRTEAEVGSSGGHGLVGDRLVQRPGFSWRSPGFAQDDDHPVVLVTWADARAFCTWLGRRLGRVVDLPSEAEWEYACRGGPDGTWNGTADAPSGGTRPVGDGAGHPLGLSDLLGHVNQWCVDWYTPVLPAEAVDPCITAAGTQPARRVLRGGSFLGEPHRRRAAARWRNTPGTRNADNGFRVVARAVFTATTAVAPIRELPPASPSADATAPPSEPWAPAPAGGLPGRAPAASASGGGLLSAFVGLACLSVVGGMVALLVVLFTRLARPRSPGAAPTRSQPRRLPPARPDDDGFWVDTSGLQPGTELRYRLFADGRWQEATVRTEPGDAQFVYTGLRPQRVELLALGGTALAAAAAAKPPARRSPPSRRDDFPAAY